MTTALRQAQYRNLIQAADTWALSPGLTPWTKAALLRTEKKLERLLRRRFARQAARTLPGVRKQARRLRAQAVSAAEPDIPISLKGGFTAAELAEWQGLLDQSSGLGTQATMVQLGLGGAGGDERFDLVNARARAQLRNRSRLIIKTVDDTTTGKLGKALEAGLGKGDQLQALDARVAKVMGESGWRSRMIAQTETINSYALGSETAAAAHGLTQMVWLNEQAGACAICKDLSGRLKTLPDGTYKGDTYERLRPPAHPACRCAQDPYIDDDAPIPELALPAPPPAPPAPLKPPRPKPAPKPKAKASPAPKPSPKVKGPPAKTLEFTDQWTQVGKQAGSNPGGQYLDPAGDRWYVKFMGQNATTPAQVKRAADRALNEVVGADLYRVAGVNVPEVQLIRYGGNRLGVASRMQQVRKGTPGQLRGAPGTADGFGTDAWLANWDVVGLECDNLLLDATGKAIRVDTGGSMLFRAQGAPKGKAWGDAVGEINTLRNKSLNAQAASVFGQLPESAIRDSIKRVVAVSDDEIRRIVQTRWGPPYERMTIGAATAASKRSARRGAGAAGRSSPNSVSRRP